ncbi:hypothetical protein CEXT_361201 [Caerostris extrusa]|uniref:Uncharacterized protein n=1 Tax=Caerostris extrusa TaxID=172846 RepID=A0AAV4TTK4_CAEEX|nr:hypothetical protein CEXT_361201 [Caerostris extrusa]
MDFELTAFMRVDVAVFTARKLFLRFQDFFASFLLEVLRLCWLREGSGATGSTCSSVLTFKVGFSAELRVFIWITIPPLSSPLLFFGEMLAMEVGKLLREGFVYGSNWKVRWLQTSLLKSSANVSPSVHQGSGTHLGILPAIEKTKHANVCFSSSERRLLKKRKLFLVEDAEDFKDPFAFIALGSVKTVRGLFIKGGGTSISRFQKRRIAQSFWRERMLIFGYYVPFQRKALHVEFYTVYI